MNNAKIRLLFIGFVIGIILTVGISYSIFDKAGWAETIANSENAKKELRSGLEGIAIVAGIEEADNRTIGELEELIKLKYDSHSQLAKGVGDLERNNQDQRAIIEALESELEYQDDAISRLAEESVGSGDLYNVVADFLESLGL